MIIHSLKIAWRNLLKYKTQSVISIIGLAIGFTAFSFTLSWIRYERGYDKHIQDADRIYKVLMVNDRTPGGMQFMLPGPMKEHLENLPEVEAVTAINTSSRSYEHNGRTWLQDGNVMLADSSFFDVFYPHIHISFPAETPEISDSLGKNSARDGGKSNRYRTSDRFSWIHLAGYHTGASRKANECGI